MSVQHGCYSPMVTLWSLGLSFQLEVAALGQNQRLRIISMRQQGCYSPMVKDKAMVSCRVQAIQAQP